MMRPTVENVYAELRKGQLEVEWDYEPAKYRLQVVEFSIKINIKPQDKIGEFRVPYEFNDVTGSSKSHYQIEKQLDTLPSIEMDDLDTGNLYVEGTRSVFIHFWPTMLTIEQNLSRNSDSSVLN